MPGILCKHILCLNMSFEMGFARKLHMLVGFCTKESAFVYEKLYFYQTQ